MLVCRYQQKKKDVHKKYSIENTVSRDDQQVNEEDNHGMAEDLERKSLPTLTGHPQHAAGMEEWEVINDCYYQDATDIGSYYT